ncbi:MAG TPA: LysR family transcriptional regulator [Chloroflexota bacterium]|nr:LysR family transcriptional regulator [Chloroflexota bacterium]
MALELSVTELRILTALAGGQTLTAVGQAMHLEPSAISKAVKAAERKAAVQLVERDGRRLRLTSAGKDVAASAAAVLRHVDDLTMFTEQLHDGQAGTIRIIANTTPATYVVPRALAEFLERHPEARALVEVVGPNIWKHLLAEGYDLGIAHAVVPPELDAELLYEDEFVLFVGADSRMAIESPDIERLRLETIIGPFSEDLSIEPWHEMARRGFSFRRRIEVHNQEAVKRLVIAGAGIGLLFRSVVSQETADRRLVALEQFELSPKMPFWLGVRPGLRGLPLVRDFIDILRTSRGGRT